MNYQFGRRLQTESADRLHTSPSRHSDSRPRFQRNSPHSNRTSPSRSSEDSPAHQKFIKFNKISRVQLDPDDFFQGFSTEYVRKEQEEQREDEGAEKKYTRSRENSLVRLKTLQKEMSRKERDFQELKKENARLKQALDKEIEKRRQVEKNLKSNTILLSELQRKCRESDTAQANLARQVRFLQEKRYSKEQRLQFSFRQKGLLQQISRLKNVQLAHNNLQFLQRQNRRLQIEKEEVQAENNYLKISQRTIVNRLLHFQKQLKVAIKLEEEFFELRHKYQQLAKKERLERKELEQLKLRTQADDLSSVGQSLTYSSSSAASIPVRTLARTIKYHHQHQSHPRRPNAS